MALSFALFTACGSSNDEETTDTGSGANACVPGQSIACVGPASCQGYQICETDGSGYGACQCGSVSSGAGGAGTLAAGGTSGAGLGGATGVGFGGSGTVSQGGTATVAVGGSGTGCQPSSMVGWVAPAYVPAHAKQAVCSDAQLQNYLACLRGGDCTEYAAGAAGEVCGKCLAPSPLGEKSWGPIIEILPSPFYRWETNFAGCVELLGGTSCAPKLQASSTCASESCTASCGPSSPSYDACVVQARTTACNAYVQQASCITDATMASRCSGATFDASVVAVARVFCGKQ